MPPDIELLLESISPLVTIMQYGTGSDAITTVLITGITIMSFSSNLATFSSATRLTWAWARDGGLPQFFGIVNGGVRVPTRAIGLTCESIQRMDQEPSLMCLCSSNPRHTDCATQPWK